MLINVDGRIDEREMKMLQSIKQEEKIDDTIFQGFAKSISTIKKQDIYARGLALLNGCTDEEKLCVFAYLFRLAEADTTIDMNEIRLLMSAIKQTNVDFEDVEMITRLSSSDKHAA
jgi:uncharacterized tellurite resistance protein B-like protein